MRRDIVIFVFVSICVTLAVYFTSMNLYNSYQNTNYEYEIGCRSANGQLDVYENHIRDVKISDGGNVITFRNRSYKAEHENKYGTYTLLNKSCIIYKKDRNE